MPAIPMYTQQTQAGGTITAQPTPDDFGAGVAQATSRIGAGLQDVATAGFLQRRDDDLLLKQEKEKDARSWAGLAASQAHLDWTQQLQDRKNAALPGAPDFFNGFITDFDKYTSQTVENAPTPAAKDFLRQHLTALRTSLGGQALAIQGTAQVGLRIDNAQTSIENSGKLVQQDPTQYSSAMNLIRETMPEVGPELVGKLNLHAIQTLTNAAAMTTLDQNPAALRDATAKAMGAGGFTGKTGVPWVDDASPEQVKSWNAAAETKLRMQDSDAARAQEAREKLASDTIKEASDLALKGGYMSPSYQATLRNTTQGTSYAAQANDLINGQAQVSGFATAPASDRNAVLNDLRKRATTQGTDPEGAKQVDKMAGVDAEIQKAAAQNAWAAASRYGVPVDAAVVPLASTADAVKLIQKRSQMQGQIETWAGYPVSPLQPAEASQLSDLLSAMPPPARGAALAQIGQGLPIGRLTALADQLDAKDKPQALALKLGSDQTTAGRTMGDLVLRGAQSLKDKSIKPDDSTVAGWRSTIAGMVRGTLGDQHAEDDIIDSAYYVRAAMENDGNAIPGFGMTATEKQAVKMVVGEPLERNGVKTLLPRGMNESGFDKALDAWTPDKLKTVAPSGTLYLRGQPVDLQRFSDSIGRYGWKRDGQGNFLPSTAGAFITTDKAGTLPLRLPITPVP